MKKHEEGYALVLVLVVITVLALVAAALMGYSLRNLQSQTASIDRMVAKYEAAGKIEMVVAKLSQKTELTLDAGEEVATMVQAWITDCGIGSPTVNSVTPDDGDGLEEPTSYTFSGTISIEAEEETVKIQCELDISGKITKKENLTDKYTVEQVKITYKTYDISTAEGGGS